MGDQSKILNNINLEPHEQKKYVWKIVNGYMQWRRRKFQHAIVYIRRAQSFTNWN